MNKSISILGCGWLGKPLAKHFLNRGFEVKGSTTTPEKVDSLKENGITPYLLNSKNLDEEQYGEFLNTDVVVVTISPQSKQVMGKLARDIANSPAAKAIFVGSTAVYPNTGGEMTESDAEYIKSPHSGRVMKELEDAFLEQDNLNTTVVRFGGLFGPGRTPGKFMAGFKGLSGGEKPVNMIHLDDCIGIIETIVDQNAYGEVFNACAPEHPLRKDFYVEAAVKAGVAPPEFLKPEEEDVSKFKIVNSDKLIEELNYNFKYPNPLDAL